MANASERQAAARTLFEKITATAEEADDFPAHERAKILAALAEAYARIAEHSA